MDAKKVGFIGFGEVGKAFSQEMRTKGAELYYYDVVNKKPENWITFLSLPELIQGCDIILSTVSTHVAIEVAKEAAKYLTSGKIYGDMNSASAGVKKRIAEIIERSNADFIEGAILSAVGEAGPKASILVSGRRGEEFATLLNRLGLINVKYFSAKVGEASQVKMIRSVFSKGMECLLLEMLIAGRRAGVAEYLWEDIVGFMTQSSFDKVAENWIKTHATAFERRYHEMVQVVGTLKEIGVEPLMTRGTRDFFERSFTLGLEKAFKAKPDSFWDVPNHMERELKNKP